MPKITKIIKFLFFLVVTLLVFYLIFRKIDYLSLKEILLNANLLYLVIGLLIIFLAPIFSAKEWQSMMGVMNYSISFRNTQNGGKWPLTKP